MKTFPVHQLFPVRTNAFVLLFTTLVLCFGLAPLQAQNGAPASVPTPGTESVEPAAAESSYKIIRDVNGSGGRLMSAGNFRIHGTVSQTTIGRVVRPNANNDLHNVGFWYWAKENKAFACVRFPITQAEPGTTISIPLLIEQTERLPVSSALRFQARIRFNRSLLMPVGETPECLYDGDDCLLDIDVVVTPEAIQRGVLTELRFLTKLGNAESTPLVIEEYAWTGYGEQPITTVTKPGEFALLGVCREGGEVRLIRSLGPASRLRVWPNPAIGNTNVEFVSREAGQVRLTLVDAIGRELKVLAEESVESMELQRVSVDISTIASGTYFLVMRTPGEIKTTRITVEQ